jgi:hypothetical protein
MTIRSASTNRVFHRANVKNSRLFHARPEGSRSCQWQRSPSHCRPSVSVSLIALQTQQSALSTSFLRCLISFCLTTHSIRKETGHSQGCTAHKRRHIQQRFLNCVPRNTSVSRDVNTCQWPYNWSLTGFVTLTVIWQMRGHKTYVPKIFAKLKSGPLPKKKFCKYSHCECLSLI